MMKLTAEQIDAIQTLIDRVDCTYDVDGIPEEEQQAIDVLVALLQEQESSKQYRITFQTPAAHTIYFSMVESMLDNVINEDTESDKAEQLQSLLDLLRENDTSSIIIPNKLRAIAGDVLENCLDNYGGNEEDTLNAGDVVISEE